jgi:hypothetical protein
MSGGGNVRLLVIFQAGNHLGALIEIASFAMTNAGPCKMEIDH